MSLMETAIGILLLAGVHVRLIGGIAAGLIAVFTLASLLRKNVTGDCGCMGRILPARSRWQLSLRNVAFLVMSLPSLMTEHAGFSLAGTIRDYAVLLGIGAAAWMVYLHRQFRDMRVRSGVGSRVDRILLSHHPR